ncbi:MAG: transglutaminase domain-containing protein [Thermoplasmatota archaeon]
MIDTKRKIISLLIIVILLVTSLAALTSHIGNFGYTKTEDDKNDDGSSTLDYAFSIKNADNTSFLKTEVGLDYENGTWSFNNSHFYNYNNENTEYEVNNFEKVKIDTPLVTPLNTLKKGFIPVSTYTDRVEGFDDLDYYPGQNIFYSSENYSHSYSFKTSHYRYNMSVLNNSKKIEDDRYLSLPSNISSGVVGLAEQITEEETSTFIKALKIQNYLRENLNYSSNVDVPTYVDDPVRWFLFEEKQGNSSLFNTAFVLMARSVGVPCRLVKGYNIQPMAETQTVDSSDKHVWAEVGLEAGWINFDGTPQSSLSGGSCGNCLVAGESDDDGDGDSGEGGQGESSPTKNDKISPEGSNEMSPSRALFSVSGNEHTSYLKNVVGINYNGEYFELGNESFDAYNSEDIDHDIYGYKESVNDNVTIDPIIEFYPGFIPVSLYTDNVDIEEGMTNLTYYPEQNIFYSNSNFTDDYSFKTTHHNFYESTLENADGINQEKYLQFPDVISERTRKLANKITEGYTSPYRKAVSIKEYLMKNYNYSKNYTKAPDGHEPIDWFLFEEKKGVCANFNSAYAVLSRIADVPTRVVSGFRVPNTANETLVISSQSHSWIEVGLDIGWITMDATPGSAQGGSGEANIIETETEITEVSKNNIKKGEEFFVNGTVNSSSGISVDGMNVKIYLKKNKSIEANGIQCGKGLVQNSEFNIECEMPRYIDVGQYQLMAQAVTDNIYKESWSDPPVNVTSDTDIDFIMPKITYRNNTVGIKGKLTEEEGNYNLTFKPIQLYINNRKITELITDEYGNFSHELKFSQIGNYSVKVEYEGTEYYSSSSESKNISVKRITLDSFDNLIIVDGKTTIDGKLTVDSKPVSREDIELSLNDENHTNLYTGFKGYFSYGLNENVKRGKSILNINIHKTGLSIEREVSIKTKTELRISILKKNEETIGIQTVLLDYENNKLPDNTISLNSTFQAREIINTTNIEGVSNFILKLPDDTEKERMVITAVYNGSETYSKSEAVEVIDLSYINSTAKKDTFMSDFLETYRSLLFILIPLIIGLASVGYAWKEGYLYNLISKFKNQEEKPVVHKKLKKAGPLKEYDLIKFPQIKEGLPLVWGISEKIKINIDSDGDYVRLKINEEEKNIEWNGESYTHSTVFNSEGKYEIKAIDGDKKQTVNLRIVDYRKEIQREYTNLLNILRDEGLHIGNRVTPMELEYKLNKLYGKDIKIKDITKEFEKSKYSFHEINRKDYEKFIIAKMRMVDKVERIDKETDS